MPCRKSNNRFSVKDEILGTSEHNGLENDLHKMSSCKASKSTQMHKRTHMESLKGTYWSPSLDRLGNLFVEVLPVVKRTHTEKLEEREQFIHCILPEKKVVGLPSHNTGF